MRIAIAPNWSIYLPLVMWPFGALAAYGAIISAADSTYPAVAVMGLISLLFFAAGQLPVLIRVGMVVIRSPFFGWPLVWLDAGSFVEAAGKSVEVIARGGRPRRVAGVLPVRDVAEDEVVRHVAQFAERCNSVMRFDSRER